MTWGRTTRVVGIIAALVIVAACARPNADGWWDESAHAVDGYWVTHEHPCEPQGDEDCKTAIEAATAILHATDPGATITEAVTAGYPTMRGDGPNEVSFTIGGLAEPRFVIFDLAGGSRRTIGLTCEPFVDAEVIGPTVCRETEFEVWRVSGS